MGYLLQSNLGDAVIAAIWTVDGINFSAFNGTATLFMKRAFMHC